MIREEEEPAAVQNVRRRGRWFLLLTCFVAVSAVFYCYEDERILANGVVVGAVDDFSATVNNARTGGGDHLQQQQQQQQQPSWMKEYIAFHRQSIQSTVRKENPANASHFSLRNNETRYLLYTCRKKTQGDDWCGGIGDRLRGIVSALYWAMCTNRVFLMYYDKPDPLEHYLMPSHLQWLVDQRRLKPDYLLTTLGPENINKSVLDVMQELQERDDLPGIEVRTNFPINETWPRDMNNQCMQRFWNGTVPDLSVSLRHVGFWSLFQWSPQVHKRAKELKHMSGVTPSFTAARPDPYIGVHLRSGEDVGENDIERFVRANDTSIYDATLSSVYEMQRFMKKCNLSSSVSSSGKTRSEPRVYVASDSSRVKYELLKSDRSHTLHAGPKDRLNVGHVDKMKDDQTPAEIHLDAFAEIKILSEAYCLVRSNSGFSRVAVWMSNQTRQRCAKMVGFDPANTQATYDRMLLRPLSEIGCHEIG